MQKFLTCAVLAAVVTMGTLTAAPVAGFSQDLELEIDRDGPRLRLRDPECDPRYDDECRYEERRPRREEWRRAGCTENRALAKAERMGIRRARIERVGRRTIEVRGRDRRGDRVGVTFGRDRSCPILD